MEAIKTINYQDHVIKIFFDENYDSDFLNEADDIFLVYYHRSFWVTRKGFENEPSEDEFAELQKEYYFIPVYAYIHSGVSLSLGTSNYPFNCRFDTSLCGGIFIKKDSEYFQDNEIRIKAAQAVIDEYNNVLSGQVFGYEITYNDDFVDSCWGFIGYYEKSGIIDECKSLIDCKIKRNPEKYYKTLEIVF